jgi:DHA1 family inner membrane transport protein
MAVRGFDRSALLAAIAVGSIGLVMVGAQPAVLGELVERKAISLEGVGIVAMGEIIAVGVGVALSDAFLTATRMRFIAIAAALATAAFDAMTLMAATDFGFTAVRALAGLSEGVLVWVTTSVIVRTRMPERLASVFLVTQTIVQAAATALLAVAIIPRFGWPGSFLSLGLVSVATLLFAPFLPASLEPLAPKGTAGLRPSASVALTLLVVFCQMSAIGALWAFLEPLGTRAGFSSQAAQMIVSGVLVMQVLGGLAATVAVGWLRPAATLAAGATILAATAFAIHLLPTPAPLPFVSLSALFGFVWLFLMPFHIGLAFRADAAGRVAVLVPAAQLTGSAFGPLIASLIVVGDDPAPVPTVSAAFAIAALFAVGMVGAMTRRGAEAAAATAQARD